MLSCVSMCWTWAHLPHTGTHYSATEYTRAIADVRSRGLQELGHPSQFLPACWWCCSVTSLYRAHSPCVFCKSAIDQELHRGTLVQSRVQALLPLVLLSVFWQPVCCPGESRSPLSSLRLGAVPVVKVLVQVSDITRQLSCYMLCYVTVLTGCPCGPMSAGLTKVALSTGRQVRVDPARLYDVMWSFVVVKLLVRHVLVSLLEPSHSVWYT